MEKMKLKNLFKELKVWALKKDNDEESKMLHLAHAGCCIMILLVFQLLGIGKDDRP